MKTVYAILFLCLLIMLPASSLLAKPIMQLDESAWDLGTVPQDKVLEKIIKVKNTGSERLILQKARASCDCITLKVLRQEAAPNEFLIINAVFEAKKDTGNRYKKYIYIQTNDPQMPVARITVTGRINDRLTWEESNQWYNGPGNNLLLPGEGPGKGKIDINFFYNPGCPGCRNIKDTFLAELISKYGNKINVTSYDITNIDNYQRLMDFEKHYAVIESAPAIVFAGNKYFAGKKAIKDKLEEYINLLLAEVREPVSGATLPEKRGQNSLSARFKSFSPLVIISAGLTDGINPCAFVTVIFLISFLAFVQKTRREIFLIGIMFSFGVFLAYLFLGLGIFQLLRYLEKFNIVSDLIYFLAITIVFSLAFYSLYDSFYYWKFNSAQGMKLQLPQLIKKKIHSIIRNKLGRKRLCFIALITGGLVSILESICTGQVYFPTLVFIAREPALRAQSFFYLVLYNLSFILPLLFVVLLVYLGISSQKLVSLSRRNTLIAKLLLAVLFFGLGILLLGIR